MTPRFPTSRLYALLLLVPLVACGDDGTGPGTPAALEVTAVSPASGSSTVETGATVQVEFNQPITPASLTPSTFTVSIDGTPLTTAVSYDGSANTGTAVAPLLPDEIYEAEVTTGVRTPADSTLTQPEGWLFSTRSWLSVTADGSAEVGTSTSLQLDSDGDAHIAYRDDANGNLKYSVCTGDCTSAGSWEAVTVDDGPSVGEQASLGLGTDGSIHVSYFDVAARDLKYATCVNECTDPTGWEAITLAADGSVGAFTDLVVGEGGSIHVAYFDETNGDAVYTTCSADCTTATSWETATVDTGGDVGSHIALTIDASGHLHASYHDQTNGHLRYATCTGNCTDPAPWSAVTVDDDADVGAWTSIGVDGSGRVHVSYEDDLESSLKYATCGGNCATATSWQTVEVDSDGAVGTHTSLAVDENGRVHVTHYDGGEGDLRYFTCAEGCSLASSWQGKAARADGIVGAHSSLAVDADGRVHVSYFDQTNAVLAYAE